MRYSAFAAFIFGIIFGTEPVQAQMFPVTETYRVVVVDRAQQKIGIARLEDSPDVRQNWVYIKDNTEIIHRIWRENSEFRDEQIDWNDFFKLVKKGTCVKVHGGRNIDTSIDAKNIQF